MSGATRWLTNVIVFGLLYWSLDAGGPRATRGLRICGPHQRHRVHPTDAMPLTRLAKGLMGLGALISVGSVLLVAARAVNVLGS